VLSSTTDFLKKIHVNRVVSIRKLVQGSLSAHSKYGVLTTEQVVQSGQDSSILPAWVANHSTGFIKPGHRASPLRTTRHVLQEKFSQKPNHKSFIDQACLVKMA